MKKIRQFYMHIERPMGAPLGVRTVEFLKIAYCKDAPEGWEKVAVYRPLDKDAFVYQQGGWDYRPLLEFHARYKLVTNPLRQQKLEELCAALYPD